MTREQAVERLVSAAVAFYDQETIIRTLRSNLRRCSEYAPPDLQCGDQGDPPCDLRPAYPSRCENCEARAASRPAYQEALRKRRLAKHRLLRWASKVTAPEGK